MKDNKISIRLLQSGETGLGSGNGYSCTVSGNSIGYHSSHPEARTALIARANHSENVIRWRTGKACPAADGSLTFTWLGGIATCQGGPHRFDLIVNGTKQLEITTSSGPDDIKSGYKAISGMELRFDKQLTDMYGDCFGWFYLRIPADGGPDIDGLELEIRGEEAGSQDWMMVFEYPLDNLPKLRIDPIWARDDDQPVQILNVNIDSLNSAGTISIEAFEQRKDEFELKQGLNSFRIFIPDNEFTSEIAVDFYINDILIQTQDMVIKPVTPRKVYILPYSHNDIGYTHIQPDVIEMQCKNIDVALEMAEQTADYPPEARAKWNLEVIWALEHWWERADTEKRQQFIEAVQNGSIGLNALYANPLSGLSNLAELNHHFDLAHRVSEWTGKDIITATVTDIPGFVWSLQTSLFDNGVRYFSIAPNAGDRTGHIYDGLGDQPFYWVSPCGGKEVLTWVKGASYSLFHREKITTTGISKLMDYLRALDDKQYSNEIVALPYTIGGDNGGPDTDLPKFVKEWNELYISPQLVIATHEQLFEDFEKLYGHSLPHLSGDMTPYWEDGALSTLAETMIVRRAADRLLQAETLYALHSPGDFPREQFYRAWQQVVLWDEHTWGAWNSVSEPDAPFVKEQWRIKQNYATASEQQSRDLLHKICPEVDTILGIHEITLCNTNSFPVKEYVALPVLYQPMDETIPFQLTDLGVAVALVDFPEGWSHITLPVQVKSGPILKAPEQPIRTLENDNIRLTLDDANATITSLYHKKQRREYVQEGKALLKLSYLQGKYPQEASYVSEARCYGYVQGKLFDTVKLSGKLRGCKWVAINLTMFHAIDRIDVELIIEKLSVRDKESIHLAFPFAVEDGILRYDSAGTPVIPELNQLPGACRNFFCPTGYVDVSNAECGITVALTDAPLVEIGEITAEMPWMKEIGSSTTFYSYVLNNYWHTNYKADQEGLLTIRYSLLLHGVFDSAEAHCFTQARRQPVIAGKAKTYHTDMVIPLLPPRKPIVVLSLKPAGGEKSWLLHIINASSEGREWEFVSQTPQISVYQSSPTNEKQLQKLDSISLKPYEQVYLSVEG